MSTPYTGKQPEEHDKVIVNSSAVVHQSEVAAKPDAKSENDSLNVIFSGDIRAPSPSPSLLSIDDTNNVRLIRNPDYLGPPENGRIRSRSPTVQPQTWKGKLKLIWLTNKGLWLVMIAQMFGTLMNVTTRLLEMEETRFEGKGYHPFQILFARMGITVLCSSLYMWYKKTEHFPLGMKEVRWLLVARGLTGFFGVFGMYYSLLYLPLADATVITFLAPSLACWACSYLINEPFTRMEQIAAYVSLFGVVLIARPVSLFSSLLHSNEPIPPASGDSDVLLPVNATTPGLAVEYDKVTPAQRAMAVGIAMIGVLGATGAYTTIRWIGRRAHPLISVNYFAIWATFVSVVMMFALPGVGFLIPTGFKDWCYLLFLGFCGFVMQFLLAAGLQYEKSSRATNMVYTQMLFALGFDKLVWGTTPGMLSIIGSSLILGSAIYVAMHRSDTVEKDGAVPLRGTSEEERGLMLQGVDVDADEDDIDIQMRTLR